MPPDPSPDPPRYEPLEPDRLTWAVLLARWTDFARGAVALPVEGGPGRVRDSVADIIALQAVWFALGQVKDLDPAERAIAMDRAGVLIGRHATALRQRFAGHEMPKELVELMNDAQEAYRREKSD